MALFGSGPRSNILQTVAPIYQGIVDAEKQKGMAMREAMGAFGKAIDPKTIAMRNFRKEFANLTPEQLKNPDTFRKMAASVMKADPQAAMGLLQHADSMQPAKKNYDFEEIYNNETGITEVWAINKNNPADKHKVGAAKPDTAKQTKTTGTPAQLKQRFPEANIDTTNLNPQAHYTFNVNPDGKTGSLGAVVTGTAPPVDPVKQNYQFFNAAVGDMLKRSKQEGANQQEINKEYRRLTEQYNVKLANTHELMPADQFAERFGVSLSDKYKGAYVNAETDDVGNLVNYKFMEETVTEEPKIAHLGSFRYVPNVGNVLPYTKGNEVGLFYTDSKGVEHRLPEAAVAAKDNKRTYKSMVTIPTIGNVSPYTIGNVDGIFYDDPVTGQRTELPTDARPATSRVEQLTPLVDKAADVNKIVLDDKTFKDSEHTLMLTQRAIDLLPQVKMGNSKSIALFERTMSEIYNGDSKAASEIDRMTAKGTIFQKTLDSVKSSTIGGITDDTEDQYIAIINTAKTSALTTIGQKTSQQYRANSVAFGDDASVLGNSLSALMPADSIVGKVTDPDHKEGMIFDDPTNPTVQYMVTSGYYLRIK